MQKMLPFNSIVSDMSPSLPRRHVTDCYDHVETRLNPTIEMFRNVQSFKDERCFFFSRTREDFKKYFRLSDFRNLREDVE